MAENSEKRGKSNERNVLHTMKFTTVFWDFNGTIADDLELSLDSINRVLEKRSLPLLKTKEEYRRHFRFPIREYYKSLGLLAGNEPYKIPADEWVALYTAGIDDIPLTEGATEILEFLQNAGVRQIVLSASEKNMLETQLTSYGIRKYFCEVLGTDDVYGGGKVQIAKKWSKENSVDMNRAVLIGDTDHDFDVSLQLGCKCILFTGGHMDKKRLSECGVTLIDNLNSLAHILL